MNINICLCGAQAGCPHDLACPWPLYRGSDRMMAEWEKQWLNRKAGLTAPSALPDDIIPPTMEEVAPQTPATDFFDKR